MPALKPVQLEPEEMKKISEYRVSDEDLERFNRILEFYCGTRNFHNFTIKKGPKMFSAQRHIKTFQAGRPFIVKAEKKVTENWNGLLCVCMD